MNSREYNDFVDSYKNNMTKRQQINFILDILNMEYSKKVKFKFIEVLN